MRCVLRKAAYREANLMRRAEEDGLLDVLRAATGAGERMPLALSCSSATCGDSRGAHNTVLACSVTTCSSAWPRRPSHLARASRSCSQRSVASETCGGSVRRLSATPAQCQNRARWRRTWSIASGNCAAVAISASSLLCSSATLLRSASITPSTSVMRRTAELSLDSTSSSSP
jgi:hypothetical protein